jgi:carbon monoxide dehydrogenase subunit G
MGAMELNAQYVFPGPVQAVWELLMDPGAIAACLPGCQAFEPIGEDRYRVVLNATVAAIGGSFDATVAVTDKQAPHAYRLSVDGRGRPGFVTGEAAITLTEDAGQVRVDVAGVARIGGPVAQVGQRLVGVTARMMMGRFFNCMLARMAKPDTGA